MRSIHAACSSVSLARRRLRVSARSTRSWARQQRLCSSAACLTIEMMSTRALW